MRKRLGKLTDTDNRTDRAAAKEIYRGFNDWIDQLENRMLANGNIESASAMKTARAFTRGIKALFEPRGKDGQLTAAGRNIQKVLNDADSPESVINAILGSGGVNSSVPLGRIQTLMLVKKILSTKGKESWDDVRLAYWTRLVQDRKGQLLSPKVMKNNIDTAFNKQGSVLKALFNEKERGLIQRFGQALKDATWVDPYPSKTPYGIEAFKRMKSGQSGAVGVGKTFASTAQKRETFSQHNYIMARIYQILNQKLSVLAGYRADKAGGQLALDTIRQDITKKKPPNLGSYGSFAGAEYTDD